MRRLPLMALIVVSCAGFVLAEEYKGKIKDVDAGKGTISVTVGDKVVTVPVANDAKVLQVGKGKTDTPVVGGLAGLGPGRDVTVTTAKVDGKETATVIKVEPMAKTKLKN